METMIGYDVSLTPSNVMEYGMSTNETEPQVRTPFLMNASDDVHDFRPLRRLEGEVDPKVESAPAPAPKKAPTKKPAAKKATPTSETIAVVGEELPPA